MKKRLRKLVLPLLILFTLNEFIPSTAHPIAFALYEGAVLTLAAAEAIGLGELIMGAVVLTETVREMKINHAAAHAACTYIANEHKNQRTEGAALTAIGRDYAQYVDTATVRKEEIVKSPTTIAATACIQKQIETARVAHCVKEYTRPTTLQPVNTLSGPITYNYQNTDLQPKTTYIPGGFRTTFGNTYVQMQMVQPEEPIIIEGYELEHEYLNNCIKNIPGFEAELDNAIAHCLNTLMHTNAKMHHEKVEARLQFTHLQLPGLYGICLQNLITELLPYYFNTDGSLRIIEDCDDFDTKLHEYFIKPLKETKQYKIRITQSLQTISSTHVKESSFLNNLSNVFLQSLWYSNPVTWKQKIWSNEYNHKLLKLLNACKSNDWQTAKQYRHTSTDAEKMYDFYFNEYASKTSNAYGIYLALEQDPLWQHIPVDEKEALKQDRQKQEELNNELLLRHDWKMKLQQAWHIPDDAYPAVHKALYELTGISSTSQLIDSIFKLIAPENPQREFLIEAFFNEQGILKDLENASNKRFSASSLLLNPEHHALCHQFNQLIFAFNTEKEMQRKEAIHEALQTISKLIQEDNVQAHQLAIQSTYLAIVTQQPTAIIKEQLKGFYQPIILGCVIEDKNKVPEISICVPEEENTRILGCGQPELPEPPLGGACLPEFPESEIRRCKLIGIDLEGTVTSCGWSKGQPAIEIDLDKPSEENLNSTEDNKNNEQAQVDEEKNKEDNDTPQQEKPKNKKQPRKGAKPWDLPDHDPAIDIEKIDFTLVPYLTEEEIEFIKQCIERFLDVEGFLANDGALWRILKFEDQKDGSFFELEHIVELSDQNSVIIKMGEEIKVPEGKIEIDIETDTELIECKSGVWELKRENDIEDLKNKLLLGKKYGNDIQKPFVVVSKKPIPPMWKNWLDENNVNYREKNHE